MNRRPIVQASAALILGAAAFTAVIFLERRPGGPVKDSASTTPRPGESAVSDTGTQGAGAGAADPGRTAPSARVSVGSLERRLRVLGPDGAIEDAELVLVDEDGDFWSGSAPGGVLELPANISSRTLAVLRGSGVASTIAKLDLPEVGPFEESVELRPTCSLNLVLKYANESPMTGARFGLFEQIPGRVRTVSPGDLGFSLLFPIHSFEAARRLSEMDPDHRASLVRSMDETKIRGCNARLALTPSELGGVIDEWGTAQVDGLHPDGPPYTWIVEGEGDWSFSVGAIDGAEARDSLVEWYGPSVGIRNDGGVSRPFRIADLALLEVRGESSGSSGIILDVPAAALGRWDSVRYGVRERVVPKGHERLALHWLLERYTQFHYDGPVVFSGLSPGRKHILATTRKRTEQGLELGFVSFLVDLAPGEIADHTDLVVDETVGGEFVVRFVDIVTGRELSVADLYPRGESTLLDHGMPISFMGRVDGEDGFPSLNEEMRVPLGGLVRFFGRGEGKHTVRLPSEYFLVLGVGPWMDAFGANNPFCVLPGGTRIERCVLEIQVLRKEDAWVEATFVIEGGEPPTDPAILACITEPLGVDQEFFGPIEEGEDGLLRARVERVGTGTRHLRGALHDEVDSSLGSWFVEGRVDLDFPSGRQFQVTAQRARTVQGVLVDSEGTPQPHRGFPVYCMDEQDLFREFHWIVLRTDAEGSFTVHGLVPGRRYEVGDPERMEIPAGPKGVESGLVLRLPG